MRAMDLQLIIREMRTLIHASESLWHCVLQICAQRQHTGQTVQIDLLKIPRVVMHLVLVTF